MENPLIVLLVLLSVLLVLVLCFDPLCVSLRHSRSRAVVVVVATPVPIV